MRVQLPAQIRETMREAVSPIAKQARDVYDRKSDKPASTAYSAGASGPKAGVQVYHTQHTSGATTLKEPDEGAPILTLSQWSQRILAVATTDERPVIEAVLKRIRATDEG